MAGAASGGTGWRQLWRRGAVENYSTRGTAPPTGRWEAAPAAAGRSFDSRGTSITVLRFFASRCFVNLSLLLHMRLLPTALRTRGSL
jgi:hypothetical protein